MTPTQRWSSRAKLLPILLVVIVIANGCTRRFFRDRADDQVTQLLNEKNQYPVWQLANLRVYPDERSRFADPSNPDDPPRPPDDPAADALSPNPQPIRKKTEVGFFEGDEYLRIIAAWDVQNRAEMEQQKSEAVGMVTGPIRLVAFQQPPPKTDELPAPNTVDYAATGGADPAFDKALKSDLKTYRIKLEQASELSLFNSRDYQDRCEDVYLSALPVTLERFAFVAQFFATNQTIREFTGRERRTGTQSGDLWNVNNNVGFTKLFPRGGTLLFQLANQLVVEFGEGKPNVGISTLTLQLAQPLLRGGGYAVTLEALTQAERNLLYAIRSFARFRKAWYVFIATGADPLNAPFSFAGLTQRSVGPSFNSPGQGYLPTVLLAGLQQNEEANIAALERILRLFEAFKEGGDISDLQVGQVEQQLLRARSLLLQRRQDLQNGVDDLKLQLGLPMPLPLELDDTSIRPLRRQFDDFERVFKEYDDARIQSSQVGAPDAVEKVRAVLHEYSTTAKIVKGTKFANNIGKRWQYWEKLSDDGLAGELRILAEKRRKLLDLKADYDVKQQPFPVEEAEKLLQLESDIDLGELEQVLRLYEKKPWLKEPTPLRRERMREVMFRAVTAAFILVLADARNERIVQVRESWPQLSPLCVAGVDLLKAEMDHAIGVASQTALTYRLDLMNARAQMVDAWRQIRVRANSLLGVADVRYHLDSVTPDGLNRPFDFSSGRTRQQLIINTELPLVRLAERNQYRIAQIALQRQRRALMATEDFILNNVRTQVRQLRLLAENYKIQQRAVELAYSQVENSLDVFSQPPIPQGASGGGNNSGNAAALTQQLLNAQQSLPQAQNALYTAWINYETTRLQLYRDLELMPLDVRGVWIDECVNRDCPPGIEPPNPAGTGSTPESGGEPLPEPRKLPEDAKR